MPELPEVEAAKRVLEPQICGITIGSVLVRRPEIIAHPSAGDFCQRLTGRTFLRLERRGKFLIAPLSGGDRMILHFRMTGCLLLTPAGYPEEKHTHLVFRLENGMELRFSDTRRFGRFWLLGEGETDLYSGVPQLGMEPFDPAFRAEYLRGRLGNRKKAIKECLMDQNVVAGIGNLYSDEILFGNGRAAIPFHRQKCHDAGGISGNQRTGIPQRSVPAGLRKGRKALSRLRGNAASNRHRRKEQRFLPELPKTGALMPLSGIRAPVFGKNLSFHGKSSHSCTRTNML